MARIVLLWLLASTILAVLATTAMAGGLDDLRTVHRLMSSSPYISDQDQYGVSDKWVSSWFGDCEDHALAGRDLLLSWNVPAFVAVTDGHAALCIWYKADGRLSAWCADETRDTLVRLQDLPGRWYVAKNVPQYASLLEETN